MNVCKRIVLQAVLLVTAFAIPSLATLAVALPRTFVASTGSDSNGCTRTSPCRTFGAAIAAAATGGEVIVLDTAGYGPVTITKAISIISPDSIYAGVTVPNAGTGILLNTANVTDTVVIRGLFFTANGNANGVALQNNCHLSVENCHFIGFTTAVQAGGVLTGPVVVLNCIVKDSQFGVTISSNTGPIQAAVEGCKFINLNGFAVVGQSHSQVIVRDSSAYNCLNGFYASCGPNPGEDAEVTVENCYSGFNTNAGVGAIAYINGTAAATVRVSNSTIVDNQNGFLEQTNGVVYSRSNNTLEGNVNNNIFNTFYANR